MKKINCTEILKDRMGITLLFFISLAEVVGSKYKKFRHLPKKAVAVCIAATMIVVALPVNILLAETAESNSELPGARVETNDYGDVFLGGNYIEVGISKHGSFGTYSSPQTSGWHEQSNLRGIGLLSDQDGWNVGEEPVTGDFFLPGTEEERWILAYEKSGMTYEHQIADRNSSGQMGSWSVEPKTENASDLETGQLKAVVTGITSQDVKIVITYSFGVNDLYYTTDVAITNLGGSSIENVRFVRSFDPDQDQAKNGAYDTYNKVICNPDSTKEGGKTNYALVVARGKCSLAGFFFLTFDNRARASWGYDLAPGSAYNSNLWDSAPVTEKTYATDEMLAMDNSNKNGYVLEDGLIALTFNIGTLSAEETTDLQYQSSLDPDVQGSLQKVLSGNVNYTEEVLTELTAGADYHITCDGVTYIFENIPDSTIPLIGKAPTTDDLTSAVDYDFLGKTISIVEKNDLGENVSVEQEIVVSSRPGETRPGEILPDVPAPVLGNVITTLDSITIDPAVEIQEYSLNGQDWIKPVDGKVTFTGLDGGTGYTVYTRVAATSDYPASQISSLVVYTDSYKITLDYGKHGSEDVYAYAGETLDLDIPVFDGYIFMGWYDDATFTKLHDFSTVIDKDITLYAKFANYHADIKEINDSIDAVEKALDKKADATALANAVADLDTAKANIQELFKQIDDYQGADENLKNELTSKIETADNLINEAIEKLTDRVEVLEAGLAEANSKININASNITSLKTDVESIKTWKNEAQNAIDALEILTATQETNISELRTAVQNLQAELAVAKARIDDAEDRIAALEGKVSVLETAKQNLEAAVTALNAAIIDKADAATLNQKVSELNAAITAAEAAAKAYADEKDTALKNQLTTAIVTAKGEAITAAENLVNTAKAELQAAIDNKADTATVNAAIANLQNAITALQNAKDNYIAADAALKAELEDAIAKAKQEAIDAAKGYIPYIGTNGNWWIGDTDTGVDANGIKGDKGDKGDTGADGVGIAKIEKTATNGNVDTYTVTLTNGKTYTFTVTNGKDGADGKDGENGKDGADGKDGLTPFIGENGNWWIGDTDTGVKAAADDTIPVGSGNVTEAEGVDTVTVVAIVIAGIALLGNVLLAVLVLKKKKSLV